MRVTYFLRVATGVFGLVAVAAGAAGAHSLTVSGASVSKVGSTYNYDYFVQETDQAYVAPGDSFWTLFNVGAGATVTSVTGADGSIWDATLGSYAAATTPVVNTIDTTGLEDEQAVQSVQFTSSGHTSDDTIADISNYNNLTVRYSSLNGGTLGPGANPAFEIKFTSSSLLGAGFLGTAQASLDHLVSPSTSYPNDVTFDAAPTPGPVPEPAFYQMGALLGMAAIGGIMKKRSRR